MVELTKEKIASILQDRFKSGFKEIKDLPNPFELYDMDRAASRIAEAILNKERIVVVGDYDVDGVISSALMEEFFELIGYPAKVVIPNRFTDGYGVSPKILDRIKADVVITVDNGIGAFEAADICKERGIDLIITDHHTPSERLPDAYALIDPKQEACNFAYPDICGAQVAWFLIGALKQKLGLDIKMGRFLDLLSLAIIADVMPLVSINRPLVQRGLHMISVSSRPAFEVIRSYLNKSEFKADDIGFGIAPRINSAGRMEDASFALRFLRAKTVEEASKGWLKLESLNQLRRSCEAEATAEAIDMANPDDLIIVVAKKGWHEGVVGIVASRLADRFKKPAIVLSIGKDRAKGSGRSVGDVDLFALLDESRKYLLGFGGHKMAAGLAVKEENIDMFRIDVNRAAAKVDPSLFMSKADVMGVLPMGEIDWELMDLLYSFEPFGEANARPKFLLKNIEVADTKVIGSEGNHLKLLLKAGKQTLPAIYFRFEKSVNCGESINLVGSLQINEFNDRKSIQFLVDRLSRT